MLQRGALPNSIGDISQVDIPEFDLSGAGGVFVAIKLPHHKITFGGHAALCHTSGGVAAGLPHRAHVTAA